jgi:hypothetical protein
VHLLSQSRVRIASCDAAFERATQACGTGWPAPVVTSGVIRLAFRLVRWIHKRAGNVGFGVIVDVAWASQGGRND